MQLAETGNSKFENRNSKLETSLRGSGTRGRVSQAIISEIVRRDFEYGGRKAGQGESAGGASVGALASPGWGSGSCGGLQRRRYFPRYFSGSRSNFALQPLAQK